MRSEGFLFYINIVKYIFIFFGYLLEPNVKNMAISIDIFQNLATENTKKSINFCFCLLSKLARKNKIEMLFIV